MAALGANVTLGLGKRVAQLVASIHKIMPCLNDLLVIAQIAVALATLVYMVLKIRKILKQKKSDA